MTQLTAAQAKKINKDSLANSPKELGGVGLGDRVRTLESGTTYVTGTEAQIPVCGADGVAAPKTISGDTTITKDGVISVGANKVTYDKLDATGRKYKIRVNRSATDTAATDFELPLGCIDFAGTVKSVKLLGDTAFGQATNYSTLTVQNKGSAGSGTTSVATLGFDASNTVSQWVPKALTLSGTPANLNVAVGEALTLVKTHTGNGQALPTNFIVEVVIERTA